MHICIVIDSMHGGGTESSCLTYIQALLEKGHKIDLILLDFHGQRLIDLPESVSLFVLDRNFQKKRSTPCSIPVERIHWVKPPLTFGSFVQYWKALKSPDSGRLPFRKRQFFWTTAIADYMDREQPQIIYANLFHSGAVSVLGRRVSSTKIPIIWTVRNHSQSELNSKNFRQYCELIPHADAIHANSEGVAANEQKLLPVNEKKIITIYNPINPKIYDLASEPPSELTPWFASDDDRNSHNANRVYLVLAVGRLVKQKNFTMLVRAISEARKKKNIKLLILGEGPERQAIEREAQSVGIEKHLSMPGWLPNPYSYMKRADLFVLSSNHEGFPNALVEALACGCPVLSTDCPHGPREILENGLWGQLTPIDDHITMCNAINDTLNQKSDSEKLRNRASTFTVESSVRRLDFLFQETVRNADRQSKSGNAS